VANQTIVELVKFTADGADDIVAVTKQLTDEANKATKAYEALKKVISDPTTRTAARNLEVQRQNSASLANVEAKRLDLAVRKQRLSSGAYAQEARGLQQVAREQEKVERMERRAQLAAKYGRVGGAVAHVGESMAARGLGRAAAGIAGVTIASAKSGFSGTVEGNRLALELKLVSRELAGAFKPALEIATKGLQNLRTWLSKLNPQQQNQLALGAIGIAGVAGAHLLSKAVLGVGLGAAVRGGLSSPLALPLLAAGAGYGREATGVAAAYGGVRAGMAGRSILRGAARVAGPFAALSAIHDAGTGGFYSGLRGRGENKFVSALGAAGGGLLDLITFGAFGESFRKNNAAQIRAGQAIGTNPAGHQAVTIADAGFEQAGSAYERVTNALSLTDAQVDTRDILTQIRDIVMSALGMQKVPPPPEIR
jgi:hypothetical protein